MFKFSSLKNAMFLIEVKLNLSNKEILNKNKHIPFNNNMNSNYLASTSIHGGQ